MAKFQVRVVRTAPRACIIEVDVPDGLTPQEQATLAGDLALAKAGSHDFYCGSEGEPTYEVEDVEEVA